MSRASALGIAIGFVLASVVAFTAPAAGAATFSDSFAARELVQGLPVVVTGSNVGATREAGEPPLKPLAPAGHTVWVQWEATSSGYVSFSTCDSAIDTVLGVYTGDEVDKLAEVASAASHRPPGCSGIYDGITLFALSGDHFQIAIDGNAFLPPFSPTPVTEGALSLQIEATPPPPNDDFVNATPIVGRMTEEPGGARFYFAHSRGYNWGAGKQVAEPNHAGDPGGASVWYSWTAPESRLAEAAICCSAARLIGVYTGGALGALSEVKAGNGSVEFPADAGTVYRIAVDGELDPSLSGPRHDHFELTVAMNPPPVKEPSPIEPALPPIGLPGSKVLPPRTRIFKARVRQKAGTATFTLLSSAPGSIFRCRLDGRKYSRCASPVSYRSLKPGPHAFRAYAVDPLGYADRTPVVAHFSIRPHG